jgi:glycosyltransferase involved in cell wall biosynthesis
VAKASAVLADFLATDSGRDFENVPLRLVSVSRFDPKKGLDVLVDAVARLRDDGVAVLVDLVGGAEGDDRAAGELERALRRRVERARLGGSIRFRGLLSPAGVRSALAGSDLFVAPYRETPAGDKDGLPTAVLEAKAAGLAIVAARAGSIDDAVGDGVEGLLVPPDDPAALAAAISSLVRDRDARRRLGAAAAARVRREFASDLRVGALAERIRAVVTLAQAAGGAR